MAVSTVSFSKNQIQKWRDAVKQRREELFNDRIQVKSQFEIVTDEGDIEIDQNND